MMSAWNRDNMADQSNRIVTITGASSGLGLVAAEAFAAKGAHVVMACRSIEKGERAANQIRQKQPEAQLSVFRLDTADLSTVGAFSGKYHNQFQRLDILINNAGIMATPQETSKDGFELQLATNHLGHFALTCLLLDRLNETGNARVVTVTSLASAQGRINFDDLMGDMKYDSWGAYNQSKLANLLFSLELQRRLTNAGGDTLSLAAHPGIATTSLFTTPGSKLSKLLIGKIMGRLGQSAEDGALPTLFAATASDVEPGGYYGPTGFQNFRGAPGAVKVPRSASDEGVALRLWEASEKLTHVHWPVEGGVA